MRVQDFLAWLHVAELGESSEDDLGIILNDVLDAAPEDGSDSLEDLLDEIAEQLDAQSIDLEVVLGWAERFQDLLPARLSGLENLEKRLGTQADDLPQSDVESPRLDRLRSALATTGATRKLQLERLESQMRADWEAYSAEPFPQEAVSAESVAGHRLLQEGFDCWFDAFDLAREEKADEALASATEGNRFFKAVALWSDEVSGG